MNSICKKNEVIAIELTLDLENPKWSQYKRFVSASRQESIDRYFRLEDKIRCLYAALLVRKECMELTKIPLKEQHFVLSEGGKPALRDCDLFFNISHSGERVFACFSGSEIGVDVEEVKDAPFYVMKNVFHEAEIEYVENSNNPDTKNSRFFEIWTCKEAFGKWKGDGIIYDTKCLNTQSPAPSDHYKTYFREGYCYSVYMNKEYHLTQIQETNESLEHFFQKSIS